MSTKQRIKAEDLYRSELISDLQISPNGKTVIYALQRVDKKTEKKYSNLWIVSTDHGAPRQFTFGDQVDRTPSWSPDGKQILFLSNRKNEKQFQIYLIPSQGGEAKPLTSMQGEFGSLSWSPDSKYILCQFRKKDKDAIEREKNEKKKKLGIVQREIDRVFYKFDGYGFLPKERWHIWTINARTGRGKQLTDGNIHDEEQPSYSSDGKWIVFASNRTTNPDLEPDVIDLFIIPSKGGELKKIITPLGPKQLPKFSRDDHWIAYIGREGKSDWWKNNNVWIVPVDGSKPAINLTAQFDFHVGQSTINDLNGGAAALTPPSWSTENNRLFFHISKHGNTSLFSIDLKGQDLREEVSGNGVVGVYSFDKSHKHIAYFWGSMSDPGQIFLREMSNPQVKQLTHINRRIFQNLDLGEIEEIWTKGADNNDIQGWILKPPGFDPRKKYPSIFEIHGGPLVQYGYFFMHEFYFLAAQGYVVHFCNPRGGQGYGEKHAKAIWGDWGNKDYADLMAWVDLISKKPYIDKERMGVTGGSYGGYMTLWIIGHTQRFKAAVAQRVVSNLISMWGSSDMNWVFQQVINDKPPWEDFENTWKHSPMKYIGNAKTPTMIIHSEQDHRCPIEQGEQAFVALKTLGVDTKMIRFPEEPHGISRVGRTDRRIVRLNHIKHWFDNYLK
ncbi:MAG TPA: S9 family peptidase [Anaerolineae bacterium]|nr:S9 family peptidase [Anaerolineae bacterium]